MDATGRTAGQKRESGARGRPVYRREPRQAGGTSEATARHGPCAAGIHMARGCSVVFHAVQHCAVGFCKAEWAAFTIL